MELNKKLVNFESMNENTKLTLAEALLYTKGLAGGYGGDFPLSTASKDSIYRVPATNKFYVCTENYNGSQISAPNSNFVELSVWKNHDRLANLVKKKLISFRKGNETFSLELPEGFYLLSFIHKDGGVHFAYLLMISTDTAYNFCIQRQNAFDIKASASKVEINFLPTSSSATGYLHLLSLN